MALLISNNNNKTLAATPPLLPLTVVAHVAGVGTDDEKRRLVEAEAEAEAEVGLSSPGGAPLRENGNPPSASGFPECLMVHGARGRPPSPSAFF
jgi:hypothetical protein